MPKVFADYRHFIQNKHGQRIDKNIILAKISKQIAFLENNIT